MHAISRTQTVHKPIEVTRTAPPPRPSTPARLDAFESATRGATQPSPLASTPSPSVDPALLGRLGAARTAASIGGALNVSAGRSEPAGESDNVRLARANHAYSARENQTFDLKTKAGRDGLIAASPQIDSIEDTKNDKTRCGGAAMLNALIADGNHAKNADALEQTAKKTLPPGKELTDKEKDALAAMRRGDLTASQAAHLQELMVRIAKETKLPGDAKAWNEKEGGISMNGMLALSSKLRSEGAFANTKDLRFAVEQRPDGGGKHWVMSSRLKDGSTSYANSWPNDFGLATVSREDKSPSGPNNPRYGGDVYVDFSKPGVTTYEANRISHPQAEGEHGSHVRFRATVKNQQEVGPHNFDQQELEYGTGAPR